MHFKTGAIIGLAVVYFYYTYQQNESRKVQKTNYENYKDEVVQQEYQQIKTQDTKIPGYGLNSFVGI